MSPPNVGSLFFGRTIIDRIISQVGMSLYEWCISKPAQNTMVALAKLTAATLGTSTICNGLSCVPTSPASMQVMVNPGEIYQLANLESTVCGTLPQDTTHQIVKQGVLLDAFTTANGALAAPGTSGQSIAYLIQAQYADSDVSIDPTTGNTPVVLQFYDASNPTSPWSGPNNSGQTSNTFRKGIVSLQVKAGTAATTGSQVTPTPDSGWVGLWFVTVANGQSTITAGNITQYSSAPFLNGSLLSQIQAVPTAGRLLRTTVYINNAGTLQSSVNGGAFANSSSTFTPQTATTRVDIECQGGGGGGGAAATNTSSSISAGAGGGGGGYARGTFTSSFSGVTVTVGAGGAGGNGGNGSNGGSSSFGSLISATGGTGGSLGSATIFSSVVPIGGGPYGGGSGGQINADGGAGGYALLYGSNACLSGAGGTSFYGGGPGAAGPGRGNGLTPDSYGAGGSGALNNNSGIATQGGAGQGGVVIVREYA